MVIVVINGPDKRSSIPGRDCLHYTCCSYPWKSYESNNSPSNYRKLEGKTGFFNLSYGQQIKEKENSEFKSADLRIKKLTLCHILHVNIYIYIYKCVCIYIYIYIRRDREMLNLTNKTSYLFTGEHGIFFF